MQNIKLIILDRDGVINEDSTEYIKHPDEWVPIPGSLEAIATLSQSGYRIVIATNQSGIARGLFTENTLQLIHQKMLSAIQQAGGKIEKIYYCPHHPSDLCACRKPKPGMLKQICQDFNVSPHECLFIGDSLTDLQAGKALGCKVALVKTGKGMLTLQNDLDVSTITVIDNLMGIVHAAICLHI